MSTTDNHDAVRRQDVLFERVVAVLEEARSNVVRAVNSNMVTAYWLIGREIVEEIQGGEGRAEYGKRVLEELSKRLNARYGRGFSAANLWLFKQFYSAYPDRLQILDPTGREFVGREELRPSDGLLPGQLIRYPSGTELTSGFHPQLSWSHYRALMRVTDLEARDFYERECVECGWTKVQLERQIRTSYYERIVSNKGKEGLLPANRNRLPGDALAPIHVIKSPFVLEFLDLPDTPALHESDLEQGIIDNLQTFLLELGKGFSFVARQKNIRFDDDDFYVDLVFYNFVLKCFLLIDLKLGKLSHQDVGQMDGYVRLFEDQFKVPGDNPTIGLILCSSKSEAVARYSVLSESKQLFAAKYVDFLPTEEELRLELERERRLIEAALSERDGN